MEEEKEKNWKLFYTNDIRKKEQKNHVQLNAAWKNIQNAL